MFGNYPFAVSHLVHTLMYHIYPKFIAEPSLRETIDQSFLYSIGQFSIVNYKLNNFQKPRVCSMLNVTANDLSMLVKTHDVHHDLKYLARLNVFQV